MSGLNQKYTLGIGNQKELFGKTVGFFVGGSYSYKYKYFDDGFYGRYKLTDKNGTELNREYESQSWERGTINSIWSVIGGFGVHLNSNNDISVNIINNHSGQKTTNDSYFIEYRDNEDLRQRRTLEFNNRNLFATQIKGSHKNEKFKDLKINWIGSYALATQKEPDIRYLTNDVDIQPNGDTLFFINKSNYSYPRRYYRNMKENNAFAKIDFELPFTFANRDAKFQFGFANNYK